LFKDEKEKEQVDMMFNLGEQDLERYNAKLQTRANVDRER